MINVPEINSNCPGCQALLKIIKQQQKQIAELTARLEKVERENKRQAAPFRKPQKPNPKKPGRKSGASYGQHRRRAEPETIDETYDVPLPEQCPQCSSKNIKQQHQPHSTKLKFPRR